MKGRSVKAERSIGSKCVENVWRSSLEDALRHTVPLAPVLLWSQCVFILPDWSPMLK